MKKTLSSKPTSKAPLIKKKTVAPKPKPKPTTARKTKAVPKTKPTPTRKTEKTTVKPSDFPLKRTTVKKPVKGVKWQVDEPKGQERIQLYKACPKCILVHPKRSESKPDAKNYKFPVCTKLKPKAKTPQKCEVNCTGLLAANRRARLTRVYPDVQKLTGKLLQKFKCTKASIAREKQNLMNKKKK